jgi:hypothetical protein
MSASIGIMGSLAAPVVAYLAYIIIRARKGAVPKRWWEARAPQAPNRSD